jgi:hypothetical protein
MTIVNLFNFLNQYHDSIIAISVIFGGGWWWLNLINGLITRKISGENSVLFQHLDENKAHILNQIELLSNYTKSKDELLRTEIESLSKQLISEMKSVDCRIQSLEHNYKFLLENFVSDKSRP